MRLAGLAKRAFRRAERFGGLGRRSAASRTSDASCASVRVRLRLFVNGNAVKENANAMRLTKMKVRGYTDLVLCCAKNQNVYCFSSNCSVQDGLR